MFLLTSLDAKEAGEFFRGVLEEAAFQAAKAKAVMEKLDAV
jgi:hypothetical protein